jgi:hypothetical protein
MTRRLPARLQRQTRSLKVRADSDILREGYGADYGWVSNFAAVSGTLGDYSPGGGRPSWWVGHDQFDGTPIGPNGPGEGFGYGWDGRGAERNRSWWNEPRGGSSILPAVTRCTTVIVNPIVRTEWQVVKGETHVPTPLWVKDPMLRGGIPGPMESAFPWADRLTSHTFFQTLLTHAIWWGRSAFICQEGADGQPLAGTLRILNPFMLSNEGGYWVIDPYGENPLPTDYDGRVNVGGITWRLFVMRGLPPNDDQAPEGVLLRHFDTLRLGARIHSYQLGTFGNGVPAGYIKVLTPNFGEDKAQKLKQAWMDAHGGERKSVAVLNAQADFTPIQVKPVDNETTLLKHSHLVDVAHAFGLSASWVDTSAGASLTYANITEKRRELLDISLTGWGQQLMECLDPCLPNGTTMRIQWDRFTAPDLIAQATTLTQAIQAGWMTVDEARERVGLQPFEAQVQEESDGSPAV